MAPMKMHRRERSAPAGTLAGAAQLPVDLQVLGRLLCDDRGAIAEVLRQFHLACPKDAEALRAALAAADSPAALRCAHRLKGACRMVGAEALADVCERIERAVHAGDRRIQAAMDSLEREADRVSGFLRDWLSGDGAPQKSS